MAKKLNEVWASLGPKKRNLVLLAGAGLAMVVVAMVMDSSASTGPTRKPAVDASRTQLLLPKANDTTVETLAADTRAQADQLSRLKEQLARETADKDLLLKRLDENDRDRKPDGVTADLLNEVVALKRRLEEMETRGGPAAAPTGAVPALNDPLPGVEGPAASAPALPLAPAEPVARLRVSGEAKKVEPKASREQAEAPVAYTPPGSFLEAVLLNGMDAPTSSVAQKNPVPSVMRIKSDAVLPNHFSHNVKECFVLVSGFGVLSTERAQLRTETISCVKEDGKVIESKIDGYVVGEDGNVGARGRLVSKQGQMIARSLASGVLGGISEALTPSEVPQLSINPTNVPLMQRETWSNVAQSGLGKGFAAASKTASTFFIEMAQQMTPVVEINAGRKLTIVVIKGFELK